MALHWSSENCETPIPIGGKEAADRDRVIFATQAVGLSTVTAENLHEWLWRLWVWHLLGRGQLLGKRPAVVLRRWIGLWTNVDDETREQWQRSITAGQQRITTAAFERAGAHAERDLGLRPIPASRGSEIPV